MAAPMPVLSPRDQQILRGLDRVRLLTGRQLERLHFADIATANARGSARRRSLHRLQELGLVTTLPRQVGGVRAGSAGLVYALDARANRNRWLWDTQPQAEAARIRRPWAIGWPFVSHALDVAELFVRASEVQRAGDLRLVRYDAEPASWYPTVAEPLKPDAYLVYMAAGWEQHRWLEVDRSTESLPTLRRKLLRYLDVLQDNADGPQGVLPSVVITVLDQRRLDAVAALIDQLPSSPSGYITVHLFDDVLLPGRPPP